MRKVLKSAVGRVNEIVHKHQTTVNIAGIFVTVAGIIVGIYFACIATKADNELKVSAQRIENLTGRMDSVITGMDTVVKNINLKTDTMANILAQQTAVHPSSLKNNNGTNASRVEKYWKKGNELLHAGKLKEAITQYGKVENLSNANRNEAYFKIAVAYAKLSYENCPDSEQKTYKNIWLIM